MCICGPLFAVDSGELKLILLHLHEAQQNGNPSGFALLCPGLPKGLRKHAIALPGVHVSIDVCPIMTDSGLRSAWLDLYMGAEASVFPLIL